MNTQARQGRNPSAGMAGAQPDLSGPANIQAEQALLGALMIHDNLLPKIRDFLRPEHFAEPIHSLLYETIEKVADQGTRPTPVTLKPFLPKQELAKDLTPYRYCVRLIGDPALLMVSEDYARQIVDLAGRRALITQAEYLIERARNPSTEITTDSLVEEHFAGMADVRRWLPTEARKGATMADAVAGVIGRLGKIRREEMEPASTTGFSSLDEKLSGGMHPQRLIVWGARPGMGKTVMAIASARRAAKRGHGVGFFSHEIPMDEIGARGAASHLAERMGGLYHSSSPDDRFHYSAILSGAIDETLDDTIAEAWADLRDYELEIDDTPALTVHQIETRARAMDDRIKRRSGGQIRLEQVWIDYLQLIRMTSTKTSNKVSEVGDTVLELKQMARRLNICVNLLAQLSRGVEARDDKRPVKSDLRDSGNIEEHADVIALLYRPAYYDAQILRKLDRDPGSVKMANPAAFRDEARDRERDLEIILDKNRLGPTTTVILDCDIAKAYVGERKKG